MEYEISRRQFMKTVIGTALTAKTALESLASNTQVKDSITKPDLVVAKSSLASTATTTAIDALRGIDKFVKSGDKVLIKPNMSFPNSPGWGNTTNPDVVASVIKLCLDVGANSVLVVDHPMSNEDQCLAQNGIASACQKLKSDKIKVSMAMKQREYTEVKLEKTQYLEKIKVHKSLLQSDVFINVPVAKSNFATAVSLGMKNLMGLIWDRVYLHKIGIHQGIADLSTYIKASLIIMDCTRILITNGPIGPGETKKLDLIIAGTDSVAIDAYTVKLSKWNGRIYNPADIKHIELANRMQIGEIDVNKLKIKRIQA